MVNTPERIDYIIKEVKATQAMEGLDMPKDEEDIYRKYLKGDLSEKEVLDILHSKEV